MRGKCGRVAHTITEQFFHVQMPPHLRKCKNQVHLHNSTYEKIVTHLKKELELNSLETPDDIQLDQVSQHILKLSAEKTQKHMPPLQKKKQNTSNVNDVSKKRRRNPIHKKIRWTVGMELIRVEPLPEAPSTVLTTTTTTTEHWESQEPSSHPVRLVAQQTNSENWCSGTYIANRPSPRNRRPARQHHVQEQDTQNNVTATDEVLVQSLNPKSHIVALGLQLKDLTLPKQ